MVRPSPQAFTFTPFSAPVSAQIVKYWQSRYSLSMIPANQNKPPSTKKHIGVILIVLVGIGIVVVLIRGLYTLLVSAW